MSDRTASRLTRILAMLPWVIENPGADVDEVCDRFGYTRKELIKDLDLVFVCGLPGYGPGDLMVAYVEEDRVVVDTADYFAKAPRLTAAEGLALLASGMTVMATGQGTDVLASAVDKLGKALVPDGHEILTVDVSAEHDLGGVLRNAAIDGRVVEIVYTTLSRGDTTTRLIEPWTVFTSLGNWYVSAFCRTSGGERIFRLDRIQRVKETDERFDPPATPPEPEVRYTPSEDDVTAIIRLNRPAFWVADYYPVEIVSDEAGSRTVRFSAYDASVAAQLLIRLGADAALIEGDEVRSARDDLRSRILARYRA
jgi:proteasome accessory factor C